MSFARLAVASATPIPSGVATALEPTTVLIDTCGGYRSIAGRLYVPPDADVVRVRAVAAFAPSSSGSARVVQIYRDGVFQAQGGKPSLGGVIATPVECERIFQVNLPGEPESYFSMAAYQDSGASLNALVTSEITLEILQRKPYRVHGPALKTVQGFVYGSEVRNWAHIYANQFGSSYTAMVDALAAFDVLNLGSVVGWGPGSAFPHPKSFAGSYTPTSPTFAIANQGPAEFLADLRLANSDIRIALYTTPVLDNTGTWDPNTGIPTSGTWDAGTGSARWANFRNTLDAMDAVGDDLYDLVYCDLAAGGFISFAQLDEAIRLCRARGKGVMLNALGAFPAEVAFLLGQPALTAGDFVFTEGFYADSTNGSTATDSEAVAAMMAKQAGRGVRLAATIEELGSTTYSGMATGTPLDHWTNGRALWGAYAEAGWLIEHNRSSYDYVGQPDAA